MLHKLVWILCGALVLTLLVMAGLIVAQSVERSGDPVPVVREYVEAIARGDASEANRILDFTKLEGQQLGLEDGMLLSDGALGSATERIEVKKIVTIEREEDRAKVRATIELGGESFDHDFELEGTPGSFMSPDQWTLVTPLIGMAAINVRLPMEGFDGSLDMKFGEVAVSYPATMFSNEVRPVAALLYPAIYPVTVDGGEYFVPDQGVVRVMPINEANSDRITNNAMSFIAGGFGDPDSELDLLFSDRFAEDFIADGLQIAQQCAEEGGLVARFNGRAIGCPPITTPAVVDVCNSNLDSRKGEYDGAVFMCDSWRGVDPFRSAIAVEATEAEATVLEGETTRFRLGPYRFTEVATGRTFDGIFSPAYLYWQDGKPIVKMGDFESAD